MKTHALVSKLTDLRYQPHEKRDPQQVQRALDALDLLIRELESISEDECEECCKSEEANDALHQAHRTL